jgi:hypothetical protein
MSEATMFSSSGSKAASLRRVVAGSVTCALIVQGTRWLRLMDDRLQSGLRGDWSEERDRVAGLRIRTVAARSRVVAALRALLNAPAAALPHARVARLVAPVAGLPMPHRIALIGVTIVASVLTHAVLMASIGVPVGVVGWSFRAALLLAGALAMWRPWALWSALEERRARH